MSPNRLLTTLIIPCALAMALSAPFRLSAGPGPEGLMGAIGSTAVGSTAVGTTAVGGPPAMIPAKLPPGDNAAVQVAAAASAPTRAGLHGMSGEPVPVAAEPPAFLLFISALVVVLFIGTRRGRRED